MNVEEKKGETSPPSLYYTMTLRILWFALRNMFKGQDRCQYDLGKPDKFAMPFLLNFRKQSARATLIPPITPSIPLKEDMRAIHNGIHLVLHVSTTHTRGPVCNMCAIISSLISNINLLSISRNADFHLISSGPPNSKYRVQGCGIIENWTKKWAVYWFFLSLFSFYLVHQ